MYVCEYMHIQTHTHMYVIYIQRARIVQLTDVSPSSSSSFSSSFPPLLVRQTILVYRINYICTCVYKRNDEKPGLEERDKERESPRATREMFLVGPKERWTVYPPPHPSHHLIHIHYTFYTILLLLCTDYTQTPLSRRLSHCADSRSDTLFLLPWLISIYMYTLRTTTAVAVVVRAAGGGTSTHTRTHTKSVLIMVYRRWRGGEGEGLRARMCVGELVSV